MESLLDESLEIRSDPNPIQKKKRTKQRNTRNDEHIDELVMIALQRFFNEPTHSDALWD